MSKVITVDTCALCPHAYINKDDKDFRKFCRITHGQCQREGFPDWCPLPSLPERWNVDMNNIYDVAANGVAAAAWNNCLDAIMGDREKPIIMMSPLESVPNGRTEA